MCDLRPFKLMALDADPNDPLIPPLEQVVIFCRILGHICKLEPERLPKEPFKAQPCPSPDLKDLDEGIASKGIDFLGRYKYESSEIVVILFIRRIKEFSAEHCFHPQDVTKIVLIHELAHFVTHLGTDSGRYWADFSERTSTFEEKEAFAQEATHLLLRMAGYDHLVHVFDSLSHLCSQEYNDWRRTWKQPQKSKNNNFDGVLEDLREKIRDKRPQPINREDSGDMEDY
jgi:hypothetical protein